MSEEKDFFGKEPIGRLLLKLALPTVTAQIINMLYFCYKKALRQISETGEQEKPKAQ